MSTSQRKTSNLHTTSLYVALSAKSFLLDLSPFLSPRKYAKRLISVIPSMIPIEERINATKMLSNGDETEKWSILASIEYELYLKIKGNKKWLFAVLDDETRFWIAEQVANYKGVSNIRPLFKEAKQITQKEPERITSDGAPNFSTCIKSELPHSIHIRDITFDGARHNNKMEAMNGQTIRQREKTMRSVKKANSPILRGLQIYHNYIRPHQALNGKTPAEKAGIKIEGQDKWLTLIQNAQSLADKKAKSPNFYMVE